MTTSKIAAIVSMIALTSVPALAANHHKVSQSKAASAYAQQVRTSVQNPNPETYIAIQDLDYRQAN